MPNRISVAGIKVINLVSLLFITMIPIDCKINNFFLHSFVCFFMSSAYRFKRKNDNKNSFLACAQTLISRKSVSHYALYVFSDFQPITQHYKRRTA